MIFFHFSSFSIIDDLDFRQNLFKLVSVLMGPLMPCYVLANQVYYTARYIY
jgi:hypothetical protein